MSGRFLRRAVLALRMTRAYEGRFPRRKVWQLYWRMSRHMVKP